MLLLKELQGCGECLGTARHPDPQAPACAHTTASTASARHGTQAAPAGLSCPSSQVGAGLTQSTLH